MKTGRMSTLKFLAARAKAQASGQRWRRARAYEPAKPVQHAQMSSTTAPILSSSSGQISGQFVKPNCASNIGQPVIGLELRTHADDAAQTSATHVDETPPADQVFLGEVVPILILEQERTADLWPSDFCGGCLCGLPSRDRALLALKVRVQPDARQAEDDRSTEREGLQGLESCQHSVAG